jgi:LuxR family maltose regulon positive regulatory protein
LAALDRGRDRPLILLSGPAGFGKTTLLSQWLAAPPAPRLVSWLTVDARDDVAGFVAHLVAALRALAPGTGRATLGLLRLPGTVQPVDLGGTLAGELVTLDDDVVLVLDDVQEVADPGVYDLLDALLLHPPPRLHLVLATRLDPPLPLGRLRARGQLLELRAADLRFTADEASRFFVRAFPVPPSPEVAALLSDRAEGWAAGLRLAAVAAEGPQGQAATAALTAAFASRRQALVLEYLLEEVLDRQTPPLQDFLLRTAVPERLCAPLAAALLVAGGEHPEGAVPAPNAHGNGTQPGEVFLAAVLRANLFLIPLDEPARPAGAALSGAADTVDWYRYHSLFRDLLFRQLGARLGQSAVAALHARAGAWFAARGMVEEGVVHLLAAGDHEAAAALVERYVYPALNTDAWPALERWLNLLPPTLVRQRANLAVAMAWVAYFRGRFGAIPPLLATVRSLLDAPPAGERATDGGGGEAERRTLEAELDTFAAVLRWIEGDAPEALAVARRALAYLPEGYHRARGLAAAYGALAALVCDGAEAAVRWLDPLPASGGRGAPALVWALPGVGCALLLGGRYQEAMRAGRAALREGPRVGQVGALSWGHVLLGAVQYERDHLEEAAEHFAAAVALRDETTLLPLREGTFGLALALQAQGRPVEAAAALEQIEDALLKTANAAQLVVVDAFRVRLALLRDELAPAWGWVHTDDPALPNWLLGLMDVPVLTRVWARVRLGSETPAPAAALAAAAADLTNLLAEAERAHVVTRQAQVLALLALTQDALGQADAAVNSLRRALELGEPAGLLRSFLDLGPPLLALLRRLAARRAPSSYLDRLLAAGTRAMPAAAGGLGALPEPLTGRELEVLQRLGRRWSNKEIATDLHVTPETVKTHVAHLCAKLGAAGRREAARRAAELGLLPST